jgi:Uma2 family endonuclease
MPESATQKVDDPIFEETEELEWEPPAPPTDLIFDDGEPLESDRHRVSMNVLIRSLKHFRSPEQDFFTGGNMFIYFSNERVFNKDFRGPDFFVVLNVDGASRPGWVVWNEGGRYPDVIVELLSPTTAAIDKGRKKDLYEQVFKTRDYFIFDPYDSNSLQGWHLDIDRGYQELRRDERGWLWCQTLELYLGTWEGAVDNDPTVWLRFYDSSGHLVLLPEEAEHQRAEAEHQRAEAEHQRAEAEHQRAERLAARLRELGEDIDLT